MLRVISNVLKGLAWIIFLSCLSACASLLCEDEELLRIVSPDSKVDSLLIRRNCGATSSYVYNVFIVPTGKSSKSIDLIFKADHVDGLIVEWKLPKLLEIKYKEARIFQFNNFWQSRDVDNFRYVVEIREVPLSYPHALSPRDRWVE